MNRNIKMLSKCLHLLLPLLKNSREQLNLRTSIHLFEFLLPILKNGREQLTLSERRAGMFSFSYLSGVTVIAFINKQ